MVKVKNTFAHDSNCSSSLLTRRLTFGSVDYRSIPQEKWGPNYL